MAGNAATPARATAVATPNATEGVALTVPVIPGDLTSSNIANLPGVGNTANYEINGVLNVTPGATTTAVVIACRRGQNTTTGAIVGQKLTHTVAAGASASIAFEFLDAVTAASVASAPLNGYSITIQQTGGTAPGTVNDIVGKVRDYI